MRLQRLTAPGRQVSILTPWLQRRQILPARVGRQSMLADTLGVGPGSVLEWDEQDDQVVVRRAGRYTSQDVHNALFPKKAPKGKPADVKEAIRTHIRKRFP